MLQCRHLNGLLAVFLLAALWLLAAAIRGDDPLLVVVPGLSAAFLFLGDSRVTSSATSAALILRNLFQPSPGCLLASRLAGESVLITTGFLVRSLLLLADDKLGDDDDDLLLADDKLGDDDDDDGEVAEFCSSSSLSRNFLGLVEIRPDEVLLIKFCEDFAEGDWAGFCDDFFAPDECPDL